MISTNKTACICSSYLACQFAQKKDILCTIIWKFSKFVYPTCLLFLPRSFLVEVQSYRNEADTVGERHIPFQAARVDIFRGYGG